MNKYQYKVQGIDYDVEIVNVEGNIAQVNVNGISFEVELKQPINPATMPHKPVVTPPQPAATAPVSQPEKPAANVPTGGTKVTAPLPGTITEVKVKVGDTVKDGDTVIVLEAMKMQNNIEAECNGTVTAVLVNKGDTVMEGDALITIG
ncbi:MAG TPA: biotin/lipoyl-binding protein [Candidatus Prevotella stercoripullorum]|nr:biotin/lipoyl-binding protein [Candidatus Prevotella stercoripullorum]